MVNTFQRALRLATAQPVALVDKGLWNANTNTPTLVSGVGVRGDLYTVSENGTTNLDGHNLWEVDDVLYFNGTSWKKWNGPFSISDLDGAGETGRALLLTSTQTAAIAVLGLSALVAATTPANRVWAGPTSGSPNTPSFRALVAADIPDLSGSYATTSALALKESVANKGQADGYAPLDSGGKIASPYLPSFVDDVVEAANYAALPGTGETGKIYVTLDTNLSYRWSGSTYVQINHGDVTAVAGLTGNITASGLKSALSISVSDIYGYVDCTNASNIVSGSLALTRLASISDQTILGNVSGSSAAPSALTATQVKTLLGLGTAAYLSVGTSANNVVQLTGAAKLPAVDGSLLTALPAAGSGTELQYRNSSTLGAITGSAWDGTSLTLPNVKFGGNATLYGDAADTLNLRNSTNAQTFNVFNTYTDGSNYEKGYLTWSANVFKIFADAAGTGTQRAMQIGTTGSQGLTFYTNNTARWRVNSSGHLIGVTDNSFDIGATGATRPRTIYVGTSIIYADGSTQTTAFTGSAAAAGSASELQYRNSGSLGAISGTAWDGTTLTLPNAKLGGNATLYGDASNILGLRDSTSAQIFRIYNTYTDSLNYEALYLGWSSNIAYVCPINAGTGAARALNVGTTGSAALTLYTNNTSRWTVDTSGHFMAATDNTFDIGASAATRPRNVYVAGNITAGGTVTAALHDTPSDQRLKESITRLTTADTAPLDNLGLYSFTFSSDEAKTKRYGVIAQEVKSLFPNLVREQENGYMSVNYQDLFVLAMKKLNDQTRKIESLEARLNEMGV